MNLIINGELKIIESEENPLTLKSVINQLGLNPKSVVVEFNGVIRNPQTWSQHQVNDGDILEIVTIVGGGS